MSTERTTLSRTMAIVLVILMSIACLAACSQQQNDLQGVTVTDSGAVTVTFEVPQELTVEDVLGSEVGPENSAAVADMSTGGSVSEFVYWYQVANGGILSRNGDTYLYAPGATAGNATGVSAPPAYAMLYDVPENSSGIFNPSDSDELAERYGIKLYFDGNAPSTNAVATGNVKHVSDFKATTVTSYSDGYCVAHGSFSDGSSDNAAGAYSIDTEGNMWELPSYKVSNYCNGGALAVTSINGGDYADSLIDTEGNVIWSIAEEGEAAAEKYFSDTTVTGISSMFEVVDDSTFGSPNVYHGYFPIVFDVDGFDYTGFYIGLLDSAGKWVVEPTIQCNWYSLDNYYFVTNRYIFDYATGKMTEFGDSSVDKAAEEKCHELEDSIGFAGYMASHDGLVYSGNSDYMPDSVEADVKGFYDAQGKLVIDLSGYDLRENPEFNDGYALLEIRNAQNSDYITVIDKEGKELMEPMKGAWYGSLSDGALFYGNADDGYFDNDEAYFVDVHGKKIGVLVGSECAPFSEGLGWICTEDGWKCMDINGEVMF